MSDAEAGMESSIAMAQDERDEEEYIKRMRDDTEASLRKKAARLRDNLERQEHARIAFVNGMEMLQHNLHEALENLEAVQSQWAQLGPPWGEYGSEHGPVHRALAHIRRYLDGAIAVADDELGF